MESDETLSPLAATPLLAYARPDCLRGRANPPVLQAAMWVGLMALTRFAMMAPQPFLPLFVQQLVDSEEGLATTVGVVLAATGVASTISALLVGRLNRRFGQRTAAFCTTCRDVRPTPSTFS